MYSFTIYIGLTIINQVFLWFSYGFSMGSINPPNNLCRSDRGMNIAVLKPDGTLSEPFQVPNQGGALETTGTMEVSILELLKNYAGTIETC